jgi:hypothetical protein
MDQYLQQHFMDQLLAGILQELWNLNHYIFRNYGTYQQHFMDQLSNHLLVMDQLSNHSS